MSAKRRIHGGLLLAGGLFGVSVSVLIMGASRGHSVNAGLPGSPAADFALKDTAGQPHRLADWQSKPVVLIVAARQAKDFDAAADAINQVRDTFAKDDSVRIVGVQVNTDAGLLDSADRLPGVLETRCPGLLTLQDPDARVAQAFRTPDAPTAFVIDALGVIRARVPLDRDGAAVVIAGTVSSLRPRSDDLGGMTLPR